MLSIADIIWTVKPDLIIETGAWRGDQRAACRPGKGRRSPLKSTHARAPHNPVLTCAGTANGGSALLWASLMHLNGIENGRVVTLDAVQPNWKPGTMHW